MTTYIKNAKKEYKKNVLINNMWNLIFYLVPSLVTGVIFVCGIAFVISTPIQLIFLAALCVLIWISLAKFFAYCVYKSVTPEVALKTYEAAEARNKHLLIRTEVDYKRYFDGNR